VDTKIINVYNEKNQKLVGSGLIIVDAATEPLKVLKVLVEGLPDGRSGLWLTNFKGIPVARTLSPFDLVYLDQDYSVVHSVEISTEGEYSPFRGDPASALVLPPRSISKSRTASGDRLAFRAVDAASSQTGATPRPSRTSQKPPTPHPAPDQPASGGPQFFNSAFPLPSADSIGAPLDGFFGGLPTNPGGSPTGATASATGEAEARAAHTPVSGRLTKSAKSLMGNSPAFRPSTEGDYATDPGSGGATAISHAAAPPVDMAFSVRMPTRIMPTPVGKAIAAPAEHTPDTRSGSNVSSGRLMRSVNLAPAVLPTEEVEPLTQPAQPAVGAVEVALPIPVEQEAEATVEALPETRREPTHGNVIPITTAPSHHAIYEEPAIAEVYPVLPIAPQPAATTIFAPANPFLPEPLVAQPAPSAAAPIVAPLAIQEVAPPALDLPALSEAAASTALVATPRPARTQPTQAPAQREAMPALPVEAQQPAAFAAPAFPQQANTELLPAGPELPVFPRTQIKPAENKHAIVPHKKKPSWDVRLLYSFFPEFDPARPPEIRIPRMGEKKAPEVDDEEQLSTKLRILCWLYPDLHLEQVKAKRSEERRAVRLPMPGLVAYFFTGGSPRPHPIKDISVTGFYMCTNERWLPGTIIRITLQMIDPHGEGRDAITVHSRVVRWGPDGGGFEFVLPGFLEQ
jgi:hypothetical protein